MPASGAELLHQLAEVFNTRQFERLPELLADDARFDDVAAGVVLSGVEEIANYMRTWASAFSDMRLQALDVIGDGAAAAGEFVGSGTQDGPLATPGGEIPPTGRRMEERFVW